MVSFFLFNLQLCCREGNFRVLDSGGGPKSVHVRPESVFTIIRNRCSHCSRITVHVWPEYAVFVLHSELRGDSGRKTPAAGPGRIGAGRLDARGPARPSAYFDDDTEWLQEKLLAAAKDGEAQSADSSPFGLRYTIDVTIVREGKTAVVRTSWIIEYGTDFPRLTSCYVI